MTQNYRVLVVGVGGMGAFHAKAYAQLPQYDIAGFVVAKNVERAQELARELGISAPIHTDYYQAMRELSPEVVSINTYPDTHAEFSIHALRQGCHVFMEKPIASTVPQAENVFRAAQETKKKMVIGYILRHHPAWQRFIELARTLGKPLIMRMNLNQQSYGHEWEVHKTFISKMPALVDCGVHYADVMCQMTQAKPKLVQGMAARVSAEIDSGKHNYGQLQVVFDDDSVGWYEVGWGPMMSKAAFFIKDVIGPKGSVSIEKNLSSVDPSDVSKHAAVNTIVLHSSETDQEGRAAKEDQIIEIQDEPDHQELCKREQEYLYRAIVEDADLSDHLQDAVNSLKICYAAVESYENGRAVQLD